jgi:hypothetical protein
VAANAGTAEIIALIAQMVPLIFEIRMVDFSIRFSTAQLSQATWLQSSTQVA